MWPREQISACPWDSFLMTVLWCQWEVGKQAAQNFLFSSAFPWILNLVSVTLAVPFCAAASARSQQSIFSWQWTSTWVSVRTFLPNAEKLLLAKMKQTLFKLTRVAVNLLVICQHCEPLDTVSYPWEHWSPFLAGFSQWTFSKVFQVSMYRSRFYKRGLLSRDGISPFQSWKKLK